MKRSSISLPVAASVLVLLVLPSSLAFSVSSASLSATSGSIITRRGRGNSATIIAAPTTTTTSSRSSSSSTQLFEKIRDERRKQLGIGQGEDEYDLEKALDVNTDPLITKIIAGSFILVMISLLVVGVIIPYTTDYGEGVCNPILTAGRC